MTFEEWDERQDNMTARERGIALSAWVRQDENYAPLVEACDWYVDGDQFDKVDAVKMIEAALAAVKEQQS